MTSKGRFLGYVPFSLDERVEISRWIQFFVLYRLSEKSRLRINCCHRKRSSTRIRTRITGFEGERFPDWASRPRLDSTVCQEYFVSYKNITLRGLHGLGVNWVPVDREVCSTNLGLAKSFFKIYLSSRSQRLFLPFRDKEKVDLKGKNVNVKCWI